MKKFKFTDGCTATGISVDGKNFEDFNSNEKVEIIKTLTNYVTNQSYDEHRDDILNDIIRLLIPEITDDVKEFPFNDDNENDIIYVYTYKDGDNKVIYIDTTYNDEIIINGSPFFGTIIKDNIRKTFDHIIEKSIDSCYLNNIFMEILRTYGNMKYRYHCDQCGDSVYECTLEI